MNIINGILESNRIRNRRSKNVKFTEGYWLRSERSNGLFAAEGYCVDEIPGGMRIVAPTAHTNGRGGTLKLPYRRDLRSKSYHYRGRGTDGHWCTSGSCEPEAVLLCI